MTIFDVTVNYIPTHFAISPDGSTLYSTDLSTAGVWSLSEFNIPTQKVVKTIGQLGPLSALALGKDAIKFWVERFSFGGPNRFGNPQLTTLLCPVEVFPYLEKRNEPGDSESAGTALEAC